ncbi:hypothetical protein EVAR_77229_1 [Eumeta japonica]|uniref:Uncharacterized protein n=1 Tax=Eumeta variegata TaxID=151549 RepID=A0A4C1T238_EUMVA|nr:hypothetical protein EVAR_77229_1 [Eumeta japonica]
MPKVSLSSKPSVRSRRSLGRGRDAARNAEAIKPSVPDRTSPSQRWRRPSAAPDVDAAGTNSSIGNKKIVGGVLQLSSRRTTQHHDNVY